MKRIDERPQPAFCRPEDRSESSAFLGNRNGATVERDHEALLTIQQVADLLHVPVSWVYGRTRKRSIERLPGIRLGKYWRFREEEIHAWVESQRGGHRAA
jgi:excisionase family DNA binding protein